MRKTIHLLLLLGVLGVLTPSAGAGHRPEPHFRDVYCAVPDEDWAWEEEPISRRDARAYASTAIGDGYQWGGGCWDGDGVDDQPNDPPGQIWTGGEGGDCSGFTFKAWHLSRDTSSSGFHWWSILHYVHGPYNSTAFRDANGTPLRNVAKSEVRMMDAFARSGHMGMIWGVRATADGQDYIVEAKSEADGTFVWARSYRSSSAYKGVRRKGWAKLPDKPECGEYCDIFKLKV